MQVIIADISATEAASPEASKLGELGRRPDIEAAICEHVLRVLEGQFPGLLSCLATRWKTGRRRVAEHLKGPRRRRRPWDPKTVACAVEVLLVLSRERQGMDPLGGMSLARTALEWSKKGKLEAYQAIGWTLYGNSARLRRMPKTCENALEEASRFLLSPIDEGFYARGLGLLRHEQGRGIEAAALLDHAGRCFEEVGFDGEAGCCMALRCLLELDYGRRSYGDLTREFPLALIRMDEKAAPGLYTAARAAWAWLLATGDRREDAAALLKGWRPKGMRRLELARTQIYLGRTRRALGEFQEAEDLFARACKTYWSCGCRYEAAVATWEIGVEYARREAWSDLELLAESLALKWPAYGAIFEQVLRELRWSRGSEEGPSSLWLRVVLESAGLRPGPFLYA